jgi:hypothetical protein
VTTDRNELETELLSSRGIGGCVTKMMGFVSVMARADAARIASSSAANMFVQAGLRVFTESI